MYVQEETLIQRKFARKYVMRFREKGYTVRDNGK
jgi:hypothetical protein